MLGARSAVVRTLLSVSIARMSSVANIEAGKKAAAEKAVQEHIKSGQVVGIGSGSTIVYAVDKLADLVKNGVLSGIRCVPTSFQAKQLILNGNLELTSLESTPQIDVAIDGADEADSDLTLIKGGGGCLLQEKIVAFNARLFVVVADDRKNSQHLGTSFKYIPIEVHPLAYRPIQLTIKERLGGEPHLRMAVAKAGPVVTDNGNFLLDWTFDAGDLKQRLDIADDLQLWQEVNSRLFEIAGVIDTGLFVGMAKKAYYGDASGEVQVVSLE